MGEIAAFSFAFAAVMTVQSFYWRGKFKASEGQLEIVKAHCVEWYEKYVALVKDVRKQANQPRPQPQPASKKPDVVHARSAAQVRRVFEQINAKAIADDQIS